MKKMMFLVTMFMCLAFAVQAQTSRTVSGTTSLDGTTVSVPANITGGAFAAGDDITVSSGTLTIATTANTSIRNLTISSGATVVVTTSKLTTITGTLTINGGTLTSVTPTGTTSTITGGLLVNGTVTGTTATGSVGRIVLGTGAVIDGTSTLVNLVGVALQNFGTTVVIKGNCTLPVAMPVGTNTTGGNTCAFTLGATGVTSNISMNLSGSSTTKTFAFAGTTSLNLIGGTCNFAASQTVNNLSVSAASTLANNQVTVSGTLTLGAGALTNSTFLKLGDGATIRRISGTLASAPTFTTNVNVSYGATTIATSAATASGTVLTFSGTNGVAAGQTVTGTNIPASTTVSSFTATTVTLSNPVTSTGVTSSQNITFSTSSATTTGNELPASLGTGTLTINNAGGVTLNAGVTTTNLTLTNGALVTNATGSKIVTIANNGTITRTAGSISGVAAAITTNANITYDGSSSITTGLEWPSTPNIGTGVLTINNAGGVTLGANATVGTLTLTSGKLTLSTFNLTTSTITNNTSAGNFNTTNSNYIDASSTGRLTHNGVDNSKIFVCPVGTSPTYTPITFANTSLSTNITVGIGTATNLGATPADVLALQWYVQSSNVSTVTSNITYQFNSGNIANSFLTSNTNDLAVTSGGSTLSIASSGITINTPTPFTTTITGVTLPSTSSEYYVIGKQGSILTGNSITLGSLSGITANTVCAGSSGITLAYTIGGSYTGGNVFTAELSNSLGSFASPVSVGTLTSTAAGTINITIPSGTVAGSGYRIRVTSSTPYTVSSSDNGTNISITNTSWTGANGADANTAGNWCGGLPTSASNIIISSTSPTMSGNLTVASAAISSGLTIGSNTFTVTGALTGAGTITGSSTSSLAVGSGSTINMNITTPGTTNALAALTVSGATSTNLTSDAVVTALTLSPTASSNLVLAAASTLKLVGTTFGFTASGGQVNSSATGAFFEIAHSTGTVTLPASCLTTTSNLKLSNTTTAPVNVTGSNTVNNLAFTSGSYLLMNTVSNATAVTLTVNGTLSGSGAYEINTGASASSKIQLASSGSTTIVNNFTQQAGPSVAAGINYMASLTFSGTNTFLGACNFSNNATITLNNTSTTFTNGFTSGSATRLFKSDGLSTLIFGAGVNPAGSVYFDQTTPGTTNKLASLQMTGNANTILNTYNNLVVGTLSLGNTNSSAGLKLNQATPGATTKLTITGNSVINSGAAIDANTGGTFVELANTSTLTLPTNFIKAASKLVVNNTATATLGATVSVDSLTLTGGTLNDGGFTVTVTNKVVGGSGTHTGTGKISVTSTTGTIGTANYGNLEIAPASGTVSVAASSTPTINGTLTLTSGSFVVGSNSININGTISGTAISTTSSSNITFGGSSSAVSIPSSITALNNLTFNNSASGVYTLNAPLTVSGTLTLTNGIITLGTNNLTIAASSGGSSSSYIATNSTGNLIRTGVGSSATTLPIGTSTVYAPLTFTNTTNTPTLTVSAAPLSLGVATSANVVQLQWDIQSDIASTSTIGYQYNASNFTSFNPAGSVEIDGRITSFTTYSSSGTTGSGPYITSSTIAFTLPTTNTTFVIGNTGSVVSSSTLTVGTISTSAICPLSTINIPFTITGTYISGNIFTAQLSNASGSFSSGVQTLGTLNSTTNGTISGVIPRGTAGGSSYKVRVVSSNPGVTSAASTNNVTVSSNTGNYTGANGGDANDDANWCGGVPASSANIVISNNAPRLTTNFTVANVTLNSGIDLNGFTFTTGTISGSGTITANSGSLSIAGGFISFNQSNNTLTGLTTTGATTILNSVNVGALTIGGNVTLTSSTLNITSSFTRNSGLIQAATTGSGTIKFSNNSGTITLTTAALPSSAGTNYPNINISNTGGSTVVLGGSPGASTVSNYIQNLTFNAGSNMLLGGGTSNSTVLRTFGTITGNGAYTANTGSGAATRILAENGSILNNLTLTGGGAIAASGAAFTISGTTSIGRLEMLASAATSSTSSITITGNITMDSISNNNTNRVFVGSSSTNLTFNQPFSNGKLYFSQTTGQNFLGNLTANGSFALGNAVNLTGILKVNSGTLNIGSNLLTLKSTSIANTAIVDQVGGSIIGTATVERYIPAGYRGYRDIAPQVYNSSVSTGSIFKNWQENGDMTKPSSNTYTSGTGIFITGSTAQLDNTGSNYSNATYSSGQPASHSVNGLDYSINGNNSAYKYVNGSLYTAINSGFVALTDTKAENLDAFSGYRVLVRGDRSFNLATTPIVNYYNVGLRMYNATKLRATGNLVYGDVTYNTSGVTGTVNGAAATTLSTNGLTTSTTNGFSMIANPYACPVQWGTGVTGTQTGNTNTVFGNSNNVNGSYWYLDPTTGGAGKYIAFNALTGNATVGGFTYSGSFNGTTNNTSGYIQPGQAFFVQNSTAAPVVKFTEACKASSSTKTSIFGVTKPLSKIYLSLLKEDSATVYTRKDGAAIAFSGTFGNTTYGPQDALKFGNSTDNLYITDKGKNLSIDGRLPATASDVLPIALNKMSGKNYKLVVDASVYEVDGYAPMLKDSYRGVIKALSAGVDTITFSVDTSKASTFTNRFSIAFKPTTLAVNSIVASATLNNKIATISWNTVGEKGVSRFEVEKSADAKSFNKIGQATAKNTSKATYTTIENGVTTTTYYRIKAISEVGTVSYSNLVQLTINSKQITVYPNPFVGKVLTVSFGNISSGKYTVTVTNVLGQKVHEAAISHAVGNSNHAITVNGTLAGGTYGVTVRDANGQTVYQSNLIVQP